MLGGVAEPTKGPNGVAGGGARRAVGAYQGAECCQSLGFSGHVSAAATAATRPADSMSENSTSATAVARKRGKPAAGARAGAGAGKRRRKVSTACLRPGPTRRWHHRHPASMPPRPSVPRAALLPGLKLESASCVSAGRIREALHLSRGSGGKALPSPGALGSPEGALGRGRSGRDS